MAAMQPESVGDPMHPSAAVGAVPPAPDGAAPRAATADSRLALFGHDLRAAMSDIVGGLRLIDLDAVEPATRLQLERVRAASENLARLMEDALTVMTGEEGSGGTADSLPLGRLLHDVEMRWSGRAREKGLSFDITRTADLPRVIRLDRLALERILSNLLSNAIKYTDVGRITLHVGRTPSGGLSFRVLDDGPGFPSLAQEAPPAPRSKPGNGLGLRIAREMAGRLGGLVIARNRPEGGAETELSLPRSSWAPGDLATQLPADLPDLGRIKVLVAEDSETNQAILRSMLVALGADVEIAADGIEALNRLENDVFDAALIDIEMPRLSGIEVMRTMRASGGRHARIPIMAVTAYVLRANREAIYAAGADSIFAKPLGGLEAFGLAMGRLMDRRAAQAQNDCPAARTRQMDKARFEALLEITGPDGRGDLIDRLLSDLRSVERGLIEGCAEPDYDIIRAQTHVLIAVAGAVGADRLMERARQLNDAGHQRAAETIASVAPEVLSLLDDLIHFISGHAASEGTP